MFINVERQAGSAQAGLSSTVDRNGKTKWTQQMKWSGFHLQSKVLF